MRELKELQNDVLNWAQERKLISPKNKFAQFHKVGTELAELYTATNREEWEDAIGDTAVTLIILAADCECDWGNCTKSSAPAVYPAYALIQRAALSYTLLAKAMEGTENDIENALADTWQCLVAMAENGHTTVEHCLENAYAVIKNRKGKLVNGTFVKDVTQAEVADENVA